MPTALTPFERGWIRPPVWGLAYASGGPIRSPFALVPTKEACACVGSFWIARGSLHVRVAERGAAQAVRQGFVNTTLPLGDDTYHPVDYGFNINYYGVVSSAGELAPTASSSSTISRRRRRRARIQELSAAIPRCRNMSGLRDFYGSVMAPYFADVNVTVPGSGRCWSAMGWSTATLPGRRPGTGSLATPVRD